MTTAAGVQNVVISYFTFDGNRAQNVGANLIDLDMGPTCCQGNYANSIDFLNAPKISLSVGTGTTVENCNFSSSAIYSVWNQPGVSNAWLYNNYYQYTGANAVFLTGGATTLQYNYFFGNHREFPFCSPACPGGQLFIGFNTSNITIQDCFFNGNYEGVSQNNLTVGVEAYGQYLTFYRNTVVNHVGPGLGFAGVKNVYIVDDPNGARNSVDTNNYNNGPYDGISFRNDPQVARQTGDIIIQRTNSINGHRYGIGLITNGQPINNVSVVNNCVSGNLDPSDPNYVNGLWVDDWSMLTGSVNVSGNLTTGCP